MSDSINYGISGNVKAKAVAVGTGAQASVTETMASGGRAELEAALHELMTQLAALPLTPVAHELLRVDVEKLRQPAPEGQTAQAHAATILERLTQKLKMANVAVETIGSLGGALKTVAAIFGVPLPF
jgi:hypothetical protein